ncbi:antichymotrypsin-2-like [Zophobas morio]|uniref:antichymotrypsin-2-like n=1 Tax=Zophobas morio TaxID=2755281 RepID=UPI0030828D97
MYVPLVALILVTAVATPVEDFSTATNLFAADIYTEQIQLETGNTVVSPFSASAVLALAQSGAKGETAEELKQVLHLPHDQTTLTAIQTYHELFNESKSVFSANRIYVNEDFKLNVDFQQTARDFFGIGVENVDFSRNEEAADTINKWIEGHTSHKIGDLAKSSSLFSSTAAVLVNSLYFKGSWTNKFDKTKTKKRDFYKTPSDVVQVDTMFDKNHRYYIAKSDVLKATFLAMPIQECLCFFIIGLPDDKDGLDLLEQRAHEVFTKRDFVEQKVNLYLPKFMVKNDIDFTEILKKLGVTKLFSEDADLSGIVDQGGLHVDEVLQKSFFNVDENGIEAAATTLLDATWASLDQDTPTDFVADHPFVFYIWMNNVVLFAGRVLDPSQ